MNWLIRLAARQKTVRFCWVPSHINITGNEKADSEARRAASVEGEIYNRTLPHRDYYSLDKEQWTLGQLWGVKYFQPINSDPLRTPLDCGRIPCRKTDKLK